MRRLIIAGMLALCCKMALADPRIVSCFENFSVERRSDRLLVVRQGNRDIGFARTKHQLDGGNFNRENSLLAVYGLPDRADVVNPQATMLAVYALPKKGKRSMRKIYAGMFGSRVYEVSFSVDNRHIVVATRFGYVTIDMRTKKSTFQMTDEIDLELQECGSK